MNVIIEDIKISKVNLNYISYHILATYHIFDMNQSSYKVFFRGCVGENEMNCFFEFSFVFIVFNENDFMSVLKIVYSYFSDLILYIIVMLLDSEFYM